MVYKYACDSVLIHFDTLVEVCDVCWTMVACVACLYVHTCRHGSYIWICMHACMCVCAAWYAFEARGDQIYLRVYSYVWICIHVCV